MTKKSKVERTVEPWKGVVELWHWQRLSPWIHCYQCLERRNREKGCQLPWVALPGQMEYQQVAFWDNAGKMQTKCAEQSSVPPPPLLLRSLTFTVSPTSSQYGLFHHVGGTTFISSISIYPACFLYYFLCSLFWKQFLCQVMVALF